MTPNPEAKLNRLKRKIAMKEKRSRCGNNKENESNDSNLSSHDPKYNRMKRKHILQEARSRPRDNIADVGSSSLHTSGHLYRSPLSEMTNTLGTSARHTLGQLQQSPLIERTNDIYVENDSTPLVNTDYYDIGDPTCICSFCGASMWYAERSEKSRRPQNPQFSLCCMKGAVELPLLNAPPMVLQNLMKHDDARSRHFFTNIRAYNKMFSFTSMGGQIQKPPDGRGPYVFTMHGQNYHRIGSLLPSTGEEPKFSQLYIYDTENEESNRLRPFTSNGETTLDSSIISDLKSMIDEHNSLAQVYRITRDWFVADPSQNLTLKLKGSRGHDARVYNTPSVSEVAALVVGDLGIDSEPRDIIIQGRSKRLERISELHPSYLALQYPLLFPFGEDNFSIDIPLSQLMENSGRKRRTISMREFFAFRLQYRSVEMSILLYSGRLFQEFVVDIYTMIESARLAYLRFNQNKLRAESYKTLAEKSTAPATGETGVGKRIVLPSSFTGGARYMMQNYQDAMSICKYHGHPDLFITFTCNPKWPELTRNAKRRGVDPADCPDLTARIFKIKLDEMIHDIRVKQIFGKVNALVYTIEFQKRGLPHAHIVIFLAQNDKLSTANDIDRIISAEIPSAAEEPVLHEIVKDVMIHGPCGLLNTKSPCMKTGACNKYFPKKFTDATTFDEEGYALYMRRDNGVTIQKGDVTVDNRFVVPYNKALLLKYNAHINVEWCNQARSIKYLFKYISKGHDRVRAYIDSGSSASKDVDEIDRYYNCRYISPCEAVWRIFGFEIQFRTPSVERLSFHLPDEQNIVFADDDSIEAVLNKPGVGNSMFLAWMEYNNKFEDGRRLTYAEFPTKFVWNAHRKEWSPRKRGFSIGRLYHINPGAGELYYLRLLLNQVRGATSYADLRTVNKVVHPSFKDACYALGLLDDEREYIDGIIEASFWGSAHYLRTLFVMLLLSGVMCQPELVWAKTWHLLSEDILIQQRHHLRMPDLQLAEEQLKHYALAEVEMLLRRNGSSLRRYPSLPPPNASLIATGNNILIQEELRHNVPELKTEHLRLLSSFTEEQRRVYDEIMGATRADRGGVFFLYGYGGTGKTYIWKALTAAIRSEGHIVLNVALSGIAALLLPGGRTAHSRFAIPLQIHEDSMCEIRPGTPLAALVATAKLIIWDEAPMANRYCFEALDRSLRDVLKFSNPQSERQPFGGKVVVFGGDFRQILPVVARGSRQDIVSATINSSYLWRHCKVLQLTRNMRLSCGQVDSDVEELKEFSDWVLRIGDGVEGDDNDGQAIVHFPPDLLIPYTNDPIGAIVAVVYPNVSDHLMDSTYFQERAILAPTHEVVDKVNDYVLSLIPGEEKVFLSSDSLCKSDLNIEGQGAIYSAEYLNTIKCSGIPNHNITLKVGVPVMLLRNLDQSLGLCNGTRLIITRLGNRILEAQIISGTHAGHKVPIPRMVLSPSDTLLPFKFQRRQFPLMVSFAMTINKSQGQSLSQVGLFLPKPVFTHGQLYVAVSRVTSRAGLKVLVSDNEGNASSATTNVVYKEVFQNV